MRLTPSILLILAACNHTDTYPTGDTPLLGPFEEPSFQLTFSGGVDSAYAWNQDGSSFAYTFGDDCIGILRRDGGTRLLEMCDTRSAPVWPDFHPKFLSAVAQGPDTRVIFFQTDTNPARALPYGGSLIIADTINPMGTRHVLLTLPKTIGDSLIHALTELHWIGPTSFIAIASRVAMVQPPPPNPGAQTPPPVMYRLPRMLVRGEISGNSATLTKINGTESAFSWSFAANGDILFVKAEVLWFWKFQPQAGSFLQDILPTVIPDSAIMTVPVAGGTPTLFAQAPYGLRTLSCAGNSCIALGRQYACNGTCTRGEYAGSVQYMFCTGGCPTSLRALNAFNQTTRQFTLVPQSTTGWSIALLNPTRPEFVFGTNGNVYRKDFVAP